jgi:hypothetical protein
VTTPGFNLDLLSLQPAQLAEVGEGMARACSVLCAFATIRLAKFISEKKLSSPRVPEEKIPAARLKSS